HDVTNIVSKLPFGINYVIEGMLMTPDGRNPQVRVIWTIDVNSDIPRLVSAYPLSGDENDAK
ncbi:MAG TPA: hypothetical protein PLZ51_15960, partial [Aggregatilineales bacterium]|nr:hypothetical protein [Aggregatilineales bacterium]